MNEITITFVISTELMTQYQKDMEDLLSEGPTSRKERLLAKWTSIEYLTEQAKSLLEHNMNFWHRELEANKEGMTYLSRP